MITSFPKTDLHVTGICPKFEFFPKSKLSCDYTFLHNLTTIHQNLHKHRTFNKIPPFPNTVTKKALCPGATLSILFVGKMHIVQRFRMYQFISTLCVCFSLFVLLFFLSLSSLFFTLISFSISFRFAHKSACHTGLIGIWLVFGGTCARLIFYYNSSMQKAKTSHCD